MEVDTKRHTGSGQGIDSNWDHHLHNKPNIETIIFSWIGWSKEEW
jgi:hypothetical protein